MSDEDTKHTGDRVAAIVLLIVTGLIAAALFFAGLMLVMSSDSCGTGDTECNTGLFTIAWLLSMAFPVAGFTATTVFTFVRIGRGERSVWVPLLGLLAYGAGFAASVALAFAAVS
ncbi:MAG: hypothetical protein JHC95_18000 [Solirubrobacteraceae bacterium]|nr:hypothetical protein [Solirubrobacteraceae bacterium]